MADAASRILSGRAKKVNALGSAFQDALKHQQNFSRHQKNLVAALKGGNQETEVAVKRTNLLSRAYQDVTGSIKKYGVQISGATAAVQLLRLEQRDTAKGLEHFYKASDKIPTQLNKTGDAFENLGKTGSKAYDHLGSSLGNLVSGEFRKSWKDVGKMVGKGGLIDTFLGTEGAAGAIMTSRRFAVSVAKDAHGLAQAYNVPAEAVRDLQREIKMTMRSGTQNTEEYRKEIDAVADRMLFAEKVIGIDKATSVEFVNRAMWEFGESATDASKQLTNLNNYVEISNELLQEQGKLSKGATQQWKDDFAKAVLDASSASKHLFLNTDKLSEAMMASAHSAHKAGLSYNQVQRTMKAIPQMLGNTPEFMQQRMGGAFLKMVNDGEKFEEFLKDMPKKKADHIRASVKNIKKFGGNVLTKRGALFELLGGTEGGMKMAFKEIKNLGSDQSRAELLHKMFGIEDRMTAINVLATLEDEGGGLEEFTKRVNKAKGDEGKAWDESFAKQKKGVGVIATAEDALGKLKRYIDEISSNRMILGAAAASGGFSGLFNYVFKGGGGAAAGGLLAGGGGGGGGAAMAGGAAAAGGGGGVLASLGGMGSSFLGQGMTALTVAKLLGMGGGGSLLGKGLGLAAKAAGGTISAAATVATPLLALYGTLKISEGVAMKIAQTDKNILEWREESARVEEAIAKRDKKDIDAGELKVTKGKQKKDWLSRGLRALTGGLVDRRFENVTVTGGTAASADMLKKITDGVDSDLSGSSSSDLDKLKLKGGTSPIGLMWGRPDLAADISKALQAKGASPEAIEGALKLRAARTGGSLKALETRLAATRGGTIAERAKAKLKKDDESALAKADKVLKDRAEKAAKMSPADKILADKDKKANLVKAIKEVSSPRARSELIQKQFGLDKANAIGVLSKLDTSNIAKINPSTLTSNLQKTAKINPGVIRNLQAQATGIPQTVGGARRPRSSRTGDIPLKAGVDNMGKLTLTLDSFYDLISDYEAAKDSKLPYGTGSPR